MAHRRPASPGVLTELGFHRWLRAHLPAGRRPPLPIGDDAAAVPMGSDSVLLLTSDVFVEGTHFRRGTPARRVGQALAAVNLSDLAAKGGRPTALLVDLVAPPKTPIRWAEEVVVGAERMAARYRCHVLGGDTKPGPCRMIAGLAVGKASRDRLPPRSGAQPRDQIVVTGFVGHGGASRGRIAELLDLTPRVPEGERLARWAHAMLDTSDGLADSARILAEASGVRVVIDASLLPLHPRLQRRFQSDERRREAAFYGGDYELLAALPSRAVEPSRRALRALGTRLTVVGRVEPGEGAWLVVGGRERPMPSATWKSFESL
jgi:thiamine-monophosphate kinase